MDGVWLTGCFFSISANAASEGMLMLTVLSVLASLFSWELLGSMASLLGTGVAAVVRRRTSIELDLVVSLRHWGDASLLPADVGLAGCEERLVRLALPAAAVLEKKPRMLCCLPVEADCPALAVDGVLAGVRAAAASFSPMLAFLAVNKYSNSRSMDWEANGGLQSTRVEEPQGRSSTSLRVKWNAKKREALESRVHVQPKCRPTLLGLSGRDLVPPPPTVWEEQHLTVSVVSRCHGQSTTPKTFNTNPRIRVEFAAAETEPPISAGDIRFCLLGLDTD